jgi:DNA-binding LytR/AlgR family response regulator
MIKVVLIEDESFALMNLIDSLTKIPEIFVIKTLSSVKEGLEFFSVTKDIDLIFSDVQLNDGLSFEIFHRIEINTPIIFITAYNQFITEAFDYNGIDYLLKPVSDSDIYKAISKYKNLKTHFVNNNAIQNMANFLLNKEKRIIVRKGIEHLVLDMNDVVLFFTENKVVYVVDLNGKKFIADKNLTDLEEELDSSIFFRANRKYLVNKKYIQGYKTYEKVKLQLILSIPTIDHLIIISQENAPVFKKWIAGYVLH